MYFVHLLPHASNIELFVFQLFHLAGELSLTNKKK